MNEQVSCAPQTGQLHLLENYLRNRHSAIILAIVLISALFRIAYYLEIRDTPLVNFHKVASKDMRFFHEWGNLVAGGDFLIGQEFHPDVEWYHRMGERYLAEYPDEMGILKNDALAKGKKDFDPIKELWSKWLGGKAYHQEPLYGYIVALIYKLFGPSPFNVFIFQMILGVATNVLVFLITARCFGTVAGVFASLLAVFCGPMLFTEMVLLRTTLTLFTLVALLYAALLVMDDLRLSVCFAFGALSGLAILTQVYFAPFLAGMIAATTFAGGLRHPHFKRAGAIIAGAALVLSFLFARNVAVGIPPFTLFGNGAMNMIASNAKGVDLWEPTFSGPNFRIIMHKAKARALLGLWESMKSYDNPLEVAGLFANKIGTLLDWYEIPDNVNLYYFRSHSTALQLAPVSFLIVAPLGLAGIFASRKDWRRTLPYLLMVAISVAPLIAAATLGRYRAPLLISLIPFAGYSLSVIAFNKRVASVAAGVFIAMLSYFIFIPFRDMIRISDYQCAGEAYYYPKIRDAEKRGAYGEIAGIYEDWFRFEHGFGVDEPALTKGQAQIKSTTAQLTLEYAGALRKASRINEAQLQEKRADQLLASVGLARSPVNKTN
jgi:hypothetical protein